MAQPGTEGGQIAAAFSWVNPHPIFVIVLVGPGEIPFGIQKDFLCARSAHYRRIFAENATQDQIEHIIKLPNTSPEVFGLVQNYLYTGAVFPQKVEVPSYDVLISVWKLGHDLAIEGLCEEALEAMNECRKVTQSIPATPILIQVWKDTPEGSSIRKLLLEWAAEYMQSSESRAEFAKSLPQEVLSELVVAISSRATVPVIQVTSSQPAPISQTQRKNVHYLEEDDSESEVQPKVQRRHSSVMTPKPASTASKPNKANFINGHRASLPLTKPAKSRRISTNTTVTAVSTGDFSTDQRLNFCADLLTRMLSGPGFWTRLVRPFREPVDPNTDGVPDYLNKIEKPMDLSTIKSKMERGQYQNENEFTADVRQIFKNCYAYWSKQDPIWITCEKFEKTFEEKYSMMDKWLSKMNGPEAD